MLPVCLNPLEVFRGDLWFLIRIVSNSGVRFFDGPEGRLLIQIGNLVERMARHDWYLNRGISSEPKKSCKPPDAVEVIEGIYLNTFWHFNLHMDIVPVSSFRGFPWARVRLTGTLRLIKCHQAGREEMSIVQAQWVCFAS